VRKPETFMLEFIDRDFFELLLGSINFYLIWIRIADIFWALTMPAAIIKNNAININRFI